MDTIRVSVKDASRFLVELNRLPEIFADDPIGDPIRNAIGHAMLANIQLNFDANAAKPIGGAAPEVDLKWPPLKPATIAGRRSGRGERPALRRQALTPAQNRDWQSKYRSIYKFLVERRHQPKSVAKRVAERSSWLSIKGSTGGLTAVDVYGSRQVEILRDTGVLGNSLSVGTIDATGNYTRAGGDGAQHQVFETRPREILIGTNVEYAIYHHYGTSRMPARRLWPEPDEWPSVWWEDCLDTLVRILPYVIGRIAQRT